MTSLTLDGRLGKQRLKFAYDPQKTTTKKTKHNLTWIGRRCGCGSRCGSCCGCGCGSRCGSCCGCGFGRGFDRGFGRGRGSRYC